MPPKSAGKAKSKAKAKAPAKATVATTPTKETNAKTSRVASPVQAQQDVLAGRANSTGSTVRPDVSTEGAQAIHIDDLGHNSIAQKRLFSQQSQDVSPLKIPKTEDSTAIREQLRKRINELELLQQDHVTSEARLQKRISELESQQQDHLDVEKQLKEQVLELKAAAEVQQESAAAAARQKSARISELEDAVEQRAVRVMELAEQVQSKNEAAEQAAEFEKQLTTRITEFEKQLQSKQALAKKQEASITSQAASIAGMKEKMQTQQAIAEVQSAHITKLEDKVRGLEETLHKQQELSAMQAACIAELESIGDVQKQRITELEGSVRSKEAREKATATRAQERHGIMKGLVEHSRVLQGVAEERSARIVELEAQLRRHQALQGQVDCEPVACQAYDPDAHRHDSEEQDAVLVGDHMDIEVLTFQRAAAPSDEIHGRDFQHRGRYFWLLGAVLVILCAFLLRILLLNDGTYQDTAILHLKSTERDYNVL